MIPRIKNIQLMGDFLLLVEFDSGERVLYDVKDDIKTLPDFKILESENGLFKNYQIDSSRTCVFWTDRVDLPSDTLLEFGTPVIGTS